MKQFEYTPLFDASNMPDLDFQYDLMNEIAQKAALDISNQKELTIRSWFALAGHEFDSDQEYYEFLKNKCELVTNGKSFHVLDVVSKKEIISWVEREVTTAIIDNSISSTMEMIPTFKIK